MAILDSSLVLAKKANGIWDVYLNLQKTASHKTPQSWSKLCVASSKFLMSLTDAYESIRSSFYIEVHSLPTLDNVVAELLSEETRQGLLQTHCPNTILATPSRPAHISSLSSASRHYPRNLEKWSKITGSTSVPPKLGIPYRFKPPSHSAAVADDDPVTDQNIGIGRKVRRLFELINLSILYRPTILPQSAASVSSQNILELWHSHLGSDLHGISILKQDLNQNFEMKHLGTLSYFIGLEVSTASDGYNLSQAKYASDLLSRAGLTESKTASTPLESNVKFSPLDGTLLHDPTLYLTLVGSLMYLTVTRPDIAYVVHLVSQFLSALRMTHFAAVLRIL
ncbi:hypothetical protein RJ639_037962 [Escallonia herrerae]|uniref:Reverse transcriptase Ty1/copia-type domain-containing protein n=1 Tax=Escallonia herrerae TaxID=1293975 RepID=A0AA88WZR1_9ASTE|nr:hypothetical protein RJ639_037962 [Escallonia herrerae]